MADTNTLIDSIDKVRYNPAAIQRLVLSELEAVTDGANRIVDATNPVVFTLESAIVTSTVAINQAEALTRRQYPSLAQTAEEIYLHMSDTDFIGRFSTPGKANKVNLMFKLDEIYRYAVAIGNTGISKITIPRNTEITVNDIPLTLQYPIDIRVLPSEGLSVVYDTDKPSPVQTLSTNVVDWFVTRIGEDDFLNLTFDVLQFKITSYTANLSASNGFKKTYSFTNDFFYCRAYIKNNLGEWTEILTTHSDQVYDPNKPTLALRVVNSDLIVQVPQVYFNTGLITDNIRIDVYTTEGSIDVRLDNQPPSAYTVRWIDLDDTNDNVYSAPLNTMASGLYSNESISGGSDGLTFEELRDRVIDNATGDAAVPITTQKLATTLDLNGYELILDKDSISSRVYLASRVLPGNSTAINQTPANCSIQMLQTSIDSLIGLNTTHWNGSNRLVIKPSTLFKETDGILSVVPDTIVNTIRNATPEIATDIINDNKYLYTPFYYVMDISGSTFNLRPYHLKTPLLSAKNFVDQNITTSIDVSIDEYTISYLDNGTGYRLLVSTRSSAAFKALDHANGKVQLQMSYIPTGLSQRAVMSGLDVTPTDSEERVYQFDILTDFDINSTHEMVLKTFHLIDTSSRSLNCPLDTNFEFVFVALDYVQQGQSSTDIDNVVQAFELPTHSSYVGITQERIKVHFGDYLDRLWQRSRSVIGPENYQKYTQNIYAFYSEDIYERDGAGNIVIGYDENTQEITVNKLHNQGDPVLDNNDNPVIKHHIGDVIMDNSGNPSLVGGSSTRGMLRQMDLMLLDGVYYFATDKSTVGYRDSIPSTVSNWVINDISDLSDRLLERTELFFYPKSTTGKISVSIGESIQTKIDAAQSFKVSYLVSKEVYANLPLRTSIEKTSLEIITKLLNNTTISVSQMQSTIHATLGSNILGIEISGLGVNLKSFSVIDRSGKPQIGKKAVVLADQSIAVEDSISFEFTRAYE